MNVKNKKNKQELYRIERGMSVGKRRSFARAEVVRPLLQRVKSLKPFHGSSSLSLSFEVRDVDKKRKKACVERRKDSLDGIVEFCVVASFRPLPHPGISHQRGTGERGGEGRFRSTKEGKEKGEVGCVITQRGDL